MPNAKPTVCEFTTDVLGIALSPCQRVIQETLYGLPLQNTEEQDIFQTIAGGIPYPNHPFIQMILAKGVRAGGNTRIEIPVLLYEALYGTWKRRKAGEQTRTMLLMSQNMRGATGAAFDILQQTIRDAKLAGATVSTKTEEIVFTNGVKVVVLPNTLDSARGVGSPIVSMDECGVWQSAGKANDGAEILAQLQGRIFGLKGAKIMMVSSFYLTSGFFYDEWKAGFGQVHPDMIVFRAPTRLMNPSAETDEHLATMKRLMNPARFRRDFLCEPSERVTGFLDPELVDAAVDRGVLVRPPMAGVSYICGVDVAGAASGPRADSFALSIIHEDDDGNAVQDVSAEWNKKGDSEKNSYKIMDQMAALAKSYGCTLMYGDNYAAGYPRIHFHQHHALKYIETNDAHQVHRDIRGNKSDCYEQTERFLLAGTLRLLDDPVTIAQFKLLDRVLTDGGKSRIDHPSGSAMHDDRANALAVAILGLGNERIRHLIQTTRNQDDKPSEDRELMTLLEWALPQPYIMQGTLRNACTQQGIAAVVAKLDHRQRLMLRIELSDRREEEENPNRARLRRAGLPVNEDGTVRNTERYFPNLGGYFEWDGRPSGGDTDEIDADPFRGNREEAFERTLGGQPMTGAEQRYEEETPAPDVTEEGLMDMMGARP